MPRASAPVNPQLLTANQETEHRRLFYVKIDDVLVTKDASAKPYTSDAFNLRMSIIRQYKSGIPLAVLQKMSTQAHKYVELFDIIKVGPTSKLVYREAAGVLVQTFSQVSNYESAGHHNREWSA